MPSLGIQKRARKGAGKPASKIRLPIITQNFYSEVTETQPTILSAYDLELLVSLGMLNIVKINDRHYEFRPSKKAKAHRPNPKRPMRTWDFILIGMFIYTWDALEAKIYVRLSPHVEILSEEPSHAFE